MKHKGQFLCLQCNSCFSDSSEWHECRNFIQAWDVGVFKVGVWDRRRSKLAPVLQKLAPFLEHLEHWDQLYMLQLRGGAGLSKAERDALMPEAGLPECYRRKQ